jgi:hypothetical protein
MRGYCVPKGGIMRTRWLAAGGAVALGFGLVIPAGSVSASRTSVSPSAGTAPLTATLLTRPSPVLGTDKQRHVVYDFELDNVTGSRVRLDRLQVVATSPPGVLAAYRGDQILPLLLVDGADQPTRTLEPGQTGVIFLDLIFPRTGNIPPHLKHRLVLTVGEGSAAERQTMDGIPVKLDSRAPIRIDRPLRGGSLIALNGCCAKSDHARAVLPIGGRLVNAQRFAIDFVRFHGQATFEGDPSRNESYFIFGAPVLAVAPGRVIATRAGVPENTPPIEPPFTTFEALLGNYVVEALGDHRFALYAHLQTASLRVRAGERVHRGQVLGLVGNTGNSTEPHLHFHVTSGPSPIGSDGVPYVFRSFRYDARLVGLDTGNPSIVPADPPRARERQLPLDNDIIAFPPR